jgi:ubiquinone/menaquinone biosynthesis C-methylase UbiE
MPRSRMAGTGPTRVGMADSSTRKLQIWDGWLSAGGPIHVQGNGRSMPNPGLADGLFAAESLGRASRDTADPYSLQWFLDAEHARHHRNGAWIPRSLEFTKHGGESLLGLGDGLGTDWVQYARHGASVVACGLSETQLALVRRNFELRGLSGRFLLVRPNALPLESASIDVACVSTPLPELGDPVAIVGEIYRVLKPGGKVLAVASAKYDANYFRRFLPWSRRKLPSPTQRFSARGMRRLFGSFVEHRVYKRHLRRGDVPKPCRWLPHSLLERIVGRFVILKAFKPLSAAILVPLAA